MINAFWSESEVGEWSLEDWAISARFECPLPDEMHRMLTTSLADGANPKAIKAIEAARA
jgi:hypothetical protein